MPFGCDVMVVETGFLVDESNPAVMEEGRKQLARVIRECRNNTDGHPTAIMDAFDIALGRK